MARAEPDIEPPVGDSLSREEPEVWGKVSGALMACNFESEGDALDTGWRLVERGIGSFDPAFAFVAVDWHGV